MARPLRERLTRLWGPGSGPLVARTFHGALGLCFVVAFASLLAQVDLLYGAEGLLPLQPRVDAVLSAPRFSFKATPSLLLWTGASDGMLRGLCWGGIALGVLALAGLVPRICLGVATFIYLGFATLGAPFTSFQWDNLLLECGFLAVFLPRHRPARLIHLLFSVLAFKVYFESGVAKWQSSIGDWHDGSAMTYYYETAPLPAWLGWHAHNLPAWWHHFESRATLGWELGVPLLFFGPRRARLLAVLIVLAFQAVNVATANYGFFVPLASTLLLFCLADQDLQRVGAFLARPLGPVARGLGALARRRSERLRWPDRFLPAPPFQRAARTAEQIAVATFWLSASAVDGLARFTDNDTVDELRRDVAPLYAPFRIANTYHLFAAITRARIEPEFQIRRGEAWTPLALHYKPGPVDRTPPYVAPHQPRVDFQLWFHGLSARRGTPLYVRRVLDRLCNRPEVVAPLFVDPPANAPDAVRIVYWRYNMTDAAQRAATGDYWRRTEVGRSPPRSCR